MEKGLILALTRRGSPRLPGKASRQATSGVSAYYFPYGYARGCGVGQVPAVRRAPVHGRGKDEQMSKRYSGSCHCGAVRFAFDAEEITRGVRCNCSLCVRRGTIMSRERMPEAELTIEAPEGMLGMYQFGAHTAKHFFCRRCGIYTFHETASKPGHYRVNLGCVEGIDPYDVDAELFDGRSLP